MSVQRDPDKVAICSICSGPIYWDEPRGYTCIECQHIVKYISRYVTRERRCIADCIGLEQRILSHANRVERGE